MKMSDVFRLPVEAESGVDPYYVTKCKKLDLMDGQAQAAAHAINQHDALVAMNAELVKMASDISQMCIGEIAMDYRLDAQSIGEHIYSVTGLNSEELVAKAKELS